jgi:hypothetical protein
MDKCWLYNSDGECEIFEGEEIEYALSDGWADSPAGPFVKTETSDEGATEDE